MVLIKKKLTGTENKKIKHAEHIEKFGIEFKSRFEALVYKTFKENGFDIKYEPTKFVLWKGFKPRVLFYNAKTGLLKNDNKKLVDITYTPDFIIKYKDLTCIVEVKGIENDVFPIKRKLFREYLETLINSIPVIYFEIRNKKQLLQSINLIKEHGK